jgi:hypothetical protein
LSDVSQGPGWWQASDGKWYPPKESELAPAPGWWLAADGKWYPPAAPEPVAPPTVAANPAPAPARTPAAAASQRPPRSVEQASSRAAAQHPRPTDSDDQIRQRDAASRQDAVAQAPARFMAASRALRLLAEASEDEPTPEPRSTTAAQPDPGPDEIPLIELRTSPLGAEIDHLGDRLLVFADRVERRDRTDQVRQTLMGAAITDVVIQRKFTGAVLTVESSGGETIVTRGIKPEQADQAQALIHRHPRQGRPPQPQITTIASSAPARPAAETETETETDAVPTARLPIGSRHRINESDLLRKLADLHRAGVLSDTEFETKIALVGLLVSGESITIS